MPPEQADGADALDLLEVFVAFLAGPGRLWRVQCVRGYVPQLVVACFYLVVGSSKVR